MKAAIHTNDAVTRTMLTNAGDLEDVQPESVAARLLILGRLVGLKMTFTGKRTAAALERAVNSTAKIVLPSVQVSVTGTVKDIATQTSSRVITTIRLMPPLRVELLN